MTCTRREILSAGLGASSVLSLGSTVPGFLSGLARAATSRPSDRDTVLVVIQLSGGNDGLNTVVPYTDDEYSRNRTTLRLPSDKLHKIDSRLAFHPRMEAFLRLYMDGHLAIVQGVGHPRPDQSHDGAMRIWHTADPERPDRQTGWLGRAVDHAWSAGDADMRAVFVGSIARPFALNAERVVIPCIRSAQDLILRTRGSQAPDNPAAVAPAPADEKNLLLHFLREQTQVARAKSERIAASVGSTDYPSSALAADLRTIAQLIRADIGIRIFFAELGGGGIGGFDNHANQLGNHGALLHELAEAVAAFVRDLKRDRLLDRVLVMTFSEFGRTVRENGRRGTDHGAAAPMFLAGGKINGGLVGPHPSLTDLQNGGLKFHADFRQVYATVLDRWLGLDSGVAPGKRFEPLDILST